MKRGSVYTTLLVFILTSFFFVTTALAGRGGKGNGFPCGEHYNLNLISKKDGFTCPEESTQNVIYIPTDDEDIQIFIESGKKKEVDIYTDFIVTDWCAGFGDSNASLKLPANQEGYAVYARAVGTLGDDLNLTIGASGLNFVMDENGNNLLELGLITPDGVTGFLSEPQTIQRKKGGRANKALEITQLFQWSGYICYFSDTDINGYQCCKDTTDPPDGVYDECYATDIVTGCPQDYVPESVSCTQYDDWVFNIADMVSAFWNVDNNGVKVLQIRFYPLPLCNEQ